MKTTGQHLVWQRLVALLTVLAVAIGLNPHEVRRGPTEVLAPAPLPELRAITVLPPLVPHEAGELPLPAPSTAGHGGRQLSRRLQAATEHAPQPRALSGVRQVEGG